jgi:hypothetical protein
MVDRKKASTLMPVRVEGVAKTSVRDVMEALDVRAVMDAPWRFSAGAYQAALGVHEPWIAEISPMQYAHMGKAAKAAYDKKRHGEWEASAAAKRQWEDAVVAAFRDGRFDPKAADVHPDAETVVLHLRMAQDKAAAQAERASKERSNEITDVSQVKVGDRVFVTIWSSYGEVVKVSRKSVLVQGGFGRPMKIEVNARVPLLAWKSHDDLHGVREEAMRTIRELVEMAEATRARKTKRDFVFPDERRWPIKPKKYAIAAIQYMVMGRGDSADYPAVKKAIKAAYGDDAEVLGRLAKV